MPIITPVTTTENSTVAVTTTSDEAAVGENNVDNLSVGDVNTTGYQMPLAIGAVGEVIKVPVSGNTLIWGTGGGGGGGDITNGGQSGPVIIGSTDAKLTLIGTTGINLVGGLDIQYDEITSPTSPSLNSFTLTDAYQFIEVTNSAIINVILPDASPRPGKQFIISKGFSGNVLNVVPSLGNTIDGDAVFELNVVNQRILLVSSGTNRWLVV